ncbi:MAG TPA: FHA domain-containing protein, partial [Planctomycetota bacterium]|nr:FHA domain-containing protein [Planctomycetota bacterium]
MTPHRRLIIEEQGEDVVFDLLSSVVTAGREAGVDLVLPDPKISKRHCEFRSQNGRLTVKDLGSTNGTWVNGAQVSNAELKPGDVVQVGDQTLHVDRRAGAPAAAADRARPTFQGAAAPGSPTPTPTFASKTPRPAESVPEASTPSTRPDHARRGAAGLRKLATVGGALVIAASVVYLAVQPRDARPSHDDRRRAEGLDRIAAVATLAAQHGRGAALTELDEIARAYAGCGLDDQISARRAAVEAAFAGLPPSDPRRDVEVMPVAPPVVNAEELDADFAAAMNAGRFADASRLAERSPHRERLSEALRRRLDEERAQIEKGYAARLGSDGEASARKWLREVLTRIPVGSEVYSDLQSLLLTGIVAKREAPKAPESRSADARPLDRPAGGALKMRLAEAERLLRDRDPAAAEEALAMLASDAELGGHRTLAAETARLRRLAAAETAFRTAVVRTLQGGVAVEGAFGPSARGRAVGADAAGLALETAKGPLAVAWRDVEANGVALLLEKLPLEPAEKMAGAATLHREGRTDDAERHFARLAGNAVPELKARLDRLVADVRGVELPREGFALFGDRLMSPKEAARREIDRAIERNVRDLASKDAEVRRVAREELDKLGLEAKAAMVRWYFARQAEINADLIKDAAHKKLAALAAKRAEIDRRRTALLALIFDEKNYPYPYQPPEASAEAFQLYQTQQQLIDAATAELVQEWKAPDSVTVSPAYLDKLKALNECANALIDLDAPPTTPPPAWYTLLPKDGAPVTVQNIAVDLADRRRLDRSVEVMALNAALGEPIRRGELEQARVTNEYRLMMGRRALRVHQPMVLAARGHCDDMVKHGFFAHMSTVPGKRTPMDRLRLAGVDPSGASENLAIREGPVAALEGWKHSSG